MRHHKLRNLLPSLAMCLMAGLLFVTCNLTVAAQTNENNPVVFFGNPPAAPKPDSTEPGAADVFVTTRLHTTGEYDNPFLVEVVATVGRSGDAGSFVTFSGGENREVLVLPSVMTSTAGFNASLARVVARQQEFAEDANTVIRLELLVPTPAANVGVTKTGTTVIHVPLYSSTAIGTGTGRLNVVATTTEGGAVALPFTVTGPGTRQRTFTLNNNNNQQSQTLSVLAATEYTIAAAVPAGWQVASVACTGGVTSSSTQVKVTVASTATTTCTFTLEPVPSVVAITFVEYNIALGGGAAFKIVTGNPTTIAAGEPVPRDTVVGVQYTAQQIDENGQVVTGGNEKVATLMVTLAKGAREARFVIPPSDLTNAGFDLLTDPTRLTATIQPPSSGQYYQVRKGFGSATARLDVPTGPSELTIVSRRGSGTAGDGRLVVSYALSRYETDPYTLGRTLRAVNTLDVTHGRIQAQKIGFFKDLEEGRYRVRFSQTEGWTPATGDDAITCSGGVGFTVHATQNDYVEFTLPEGIRATCTFKSVVAPQDLVPEVAIDFVEFDAARGAVLKVLTGNPVTNNAGPAVPRNTSVGVQYRAQQVNSDGQVVTGGTEKVANLTVTLAKDSNEAEFVVSAADLTKAGFNLTGLTKLTATIQPPTSAQRYRIREGFASAATRLGTPPLGRLNIISRRTSGNGKLVASLTLDRVDRIQNESFFRAVDTFVLTHAQNELQKFGAFTNIEAGRYAARITLPDDWVPGTGDDAITCTGGVGFTVHATQTDYVEFTLPEGIRATCTFTSVPETTPAPEPSTLNIVSVTGGDGGAVSLPFTVFRATPEGDSLVEAQFNLTHAADSRRQSRTVTEGASGLLTGGRYQIEVKPPSGWSIGTGDNAITCAGAENVLIRTTLAPATEVLFTVPGGGTVTCTFTVIPYDESNSATITVIKKTTDGDGTFDYTATRANPSDPNVPIKLFVTQLRTTNGQSSSPRLFVSLGGVTITESAAKGFVFNGATCTGLDKGIELIVDSKARSVHFYAIAGADITCTFNSRATGRRTTAIINNFLRRRAEQLTSDTGRSRLLERRRSFASSGLRDNLGFKGSGDGSEGKLSYSTSLRRLGGTSSIAEKASRLGVNAADYGVARSNATPRSGWDLWSEGQLTYYKAENDHSKNDGHFALFKVGADYLINPRFLVGVVAQYDVLKEDSSSLGYNIEGRGWLAGPYVELALSPNLIIDVKGLWGTSTNDVSPFQTYTDSFTTTRWLVTARATGSWDLTEPGSNDVWRFEPSAQIAYFGEKSKSFTDSTGLRIASQDVRLGRFKFGPAISYSHQTRSGVRLTPRIAAHGLWNFTRGDGDRATNLSSEISDVPFERFELRLEGGLTVEFPNNGIHVEVEGNYTGLGNQDRESAGGRVKVRIPLQQP